ncbi:MAG: methyltransferase domain-containing protein [Phycisphaerae bacterium]|jgi:2-polyprenyl-3-methyl-5-hydroxy-6-metoxy-1,4-benzoquinol methylase
MAKAWQDFFDAHAPEYMNNVFVKDTVREVAFLIELFGLPAGAKVVDFGCGTGRHSVELAAHGFAVTGIDQSSGMLNQARQAAAERGVKVDWIQADITQYSPPAGRFDAAVCLCEGGFGLLGDQDDALGHEATILRNIHASLVPGGRFVMNALNGLRAIRTHTPEDVAAGRFDPVTLTVLQPMTWEGPNGPRSHNLRERWFVPSELALLLRGAGFEIEHIWGGTAGNWGRRPIDLEEMEVMVVARKP